MTGATNLTESDGQNAITLRVEGGRKGSSIQSQCPSFFFRLTCLAGFPIATDDFWALSSCWQHLVCGVTHTHTYSSAQGMGGGSHTHMQIFTSPSRPAPAGSYGRPIQRSPLLSSPLRLRWFGIRLPSKSRPAKPCSLPAPLPHLAHEPIPGQTTTTLFIVTNVCFGTSFQRFSLLLPPQVQSQVFCLKLKSGLELVMTETFLSY